MTLLHCSACCLLAVAACRSERTPPPGTQAPPALAKASPSDLATEIADADELGTWGEVQRRWQGQVLRWQVRREAVLCKTAEQCHVAVPAKTNQGWLPALQFAPGQFAALEARCGSRPSCDVWIRGTLAKLDVSSELPANVTFTNVTIVDGATTARL